MQFIGKNSIEHRFPKPGVARSIRAGGILFSSKFLKKRHSEYFQNISDSIFSRIIPLTARIYRFFIGFFIILIWESVKAALCSMRRAAFFIIMILNYSDKFREDYKGYMEPILLTQATFYGEKKNQTRSEYVRQAVVERLIREGCPLKNMSSKFNDLYKGITS